MRIIKITLFLSVVLRVLFCPPPVFAIENNINIVASFYPMYILTKNIVDNVPGVTVRNLVPPLTGCLHDYSITPDDMKRLTGARIFVANGAGMESFLDKVVAQYPAITIIQVSADKRRRR